MKNNKTYLEVADLLNPIKDIVYFKPTSLEIYNCLIYRENNNSCENCPFVEVFTEDGCVDFGCVLRTKIRVLMEYVK